jgi:DegV family protein with EDD domain
MIKIIADTTCGLPLDTLKQAGIETLPQIITFGTEIFRDDTEMDTNSFLEKLRASKNLPGTAAPPPALYAPIYERILAAGDTALVITPSAKVSGTFRSATVAANEFKTDQIHVIDSNTVAGGLGSLVLAAKQWADAGLTIVEVKENVTEMSSRERLFFLVPTLEYLHKGGRIGGASKLVGTLLKIVPILTIREGQVEPFDKVRTVKQAVRTIVDLTAEYCKDNPEAYLTVSECDSEPLLTQVTQELTAATGIQEIPRYIVPPAIVVHGGPGLIETSCFIARN